MDFKKLAVLIGIAAVVTFLAPVKDAQAVIQTLEAINHPRFEGDPRGEFGLALWYRDGNNVRQNHYFNFQDVSWSMNTTSGGTGNVILQGDVTDNASTGNDAWTIQAVFKNVQYTPGGSFPTDDVPYDAMLQDILNSGYGSGASLSWEETELSLTTSVINPDYKGARNLIGKANANGDKSVFRYRKDLAPDQFPGPEFDLFGMSAWIMADAQTDFNGREIFATKGDFHFAIQPNPVPEPGTMALLGFGLSGLGIIRRKKKS